MGGLERRAWVHTMERPVSWSFRTNAPFCTAILKAISFQKPCGQRATRLMKPSLRTLRRDMGSLTRSYVVHASHVEFVDFGISRSGFKQADLQQRRGHKSFA